MGTRGEKTACMNHDLQCTGPRLRDSTIIGYKSSGNFRTCIVAKTCGSSGWETEKQGSSFMLCFAAARAGSENTCCLSLLGRGEWGKTLRWGKTLTPSAFRTQRVFDASWTLYSGGVLFSRPHLKTRSIPARSSRRKSTST